MDTSIGFFTSFTPGPEDTTPQNREIQLPFLRIAPLRDPLPPQSRKPPSPLEPSTRPIGKAKYTSEPSLGAANQSTEPPTVAGFLNVSPPAADRPTSQILPSALIDSQSDSDSQPKIVLPAFINLRAVEKLPHSSFDEEALPRKRRRLEQHGDVFGDHLQLPIPKNQKEPPKHPPPFGPLTILNGLNEPPPNAALFPPIEPNGSPDILSCTIQGNPDISRESRMEKGEPQTGNSLNIEEPTSVQTGPLTSELGARRPQALVSEEADIIRQHSSAGIEVADSQNHKIGVPKLRPRKKARKWTDEETHDLLRGVVRCGVGNWTSILAQVDLNFNERTAANLKDRFRVCCSWAYEPDKRNRLDGVRATPSNPVNDQKSGKIFLPDPRKPNRTAEPSSSNTVANPLRTIPLNIPQTSSTSGSTAACIPGTENPSNPEHSQSSEKSRQQTPPQVKETESLPEKSKSALIALGISDPDATVKANRRPRRPFTRTEDEALLKGYAVHGFQWTLIRQDKHLNLMHRKATDLRDRFRTKFPNAYREGGSATAKDISLPTSNTAASVGNGPDTVIEDKILSALTTSAATAGKEPRQSLNPAFAVEEGKGLFNWSNNFNAGMATAGEHYYSKMTDGSFNPSSGAAPIDPAMLPPAPPLSSAFVFTTMDDSAGSGIDAGFGRWNDITLPPLVWDELG